MNTFGCRHDLTSEPTIRRIHSGEGKPSDGRESTSQSLTSGPWQPVLEPSGCSPRGHAVKLQQLEVLVAVAESGGIRAASRHLSLSQAAVTKAMRLLEQEAGVPLLIRKARGITLTEPGQRLLARARGLAPGVPGP
jgi:hypothetical protein